MALQLAQEEPEAGPWRAELLSTVVNAVTARRTWERADIVVCGTPQIRYEPSTEIVIAPPPATSWFTSTQAGEVPEPG